MRIRDALKRGTDILKSADIEAPAVDAGVLLCHRLGCGKAYLYAHGEEEMKPEEMERFLEMLQLRSAGMPVQYITGHQEFMSLDFEVKPGILIPRADTEVLVEAVLEWCKRNAESGKGLKALPPGTGDCCSAQDDPTVPILRILDIGTGSGCIAISLAYYLPSAQVTAVDLSDTALEVAEKNAVSHGVGSRVRFVKSDLFSGLRPKSGGDIRPCFDVIVSNPPYIPSDDVKELQREVRDFEPHTALDGGRDGLDFYRRIAAEAPVFLKPGGLLAFEVGVGEAGAVRELLEKEFQEVAVIRDLAGIERVVSGILGIGVQPVK